MVIFQKSDPIQPSADDSSLAEKSSRQLSRLLSKHKEILLQLPDAKAGEDVIKLPEPALRLLLDILSEMAEGNAVTIIPIHAELTTQQAADFLNVSRPFLVGLLDSGEIPCKRVGTHRRVCFDDLRAYKNRIDQKRLETLAELSKEAQELNLGY